MISTNQTYSDLPFFIGRNAFTNDVNLIRDTSVIRQSLKNIIMTNRGERAFDYDFGGDIYNLLFESLTVDTRFRLQTQIAMSIQKYEPRVKLNDVLITESASENALNIVIDFGIVGTTVKDKLTVSIIRTR